MADGPPGQLSIDSLNTTTANLADLYIYPWHIAPQVNQA